MRLFATICFLSVTILFGNGDEIEYTVMSLGCHTFLGNVKCMNGNPIQPDAKIVLKERDPVTPDDYINQTTIVNNIFRMYGCAPSDPPTSELEVYLEFFDVCNAGEYKLSGTLKENVYVFYNIYDTGKQVQVDS